tara:strand:+ start:511 stop:1341 length:831 start_codon:yes stop_codon:yes gene_type:complete
MNYSKIKLLFLILFSISCSSETIDENYPLSSMSIAPEMEMARDSSMPLTQSSISNSDKRIQRNANLNIEVKSINESIDKLNNIISSFGGEIISSNKGGFDYGQPYANIRLRVLSENLDSVLIEFKKLSSKVISENIYTNDVSEEFIDIEARLKIMKSTENRFNDLLSKSEKIEEIIQVEKELMRIRGDIESLEGRLNYLTKTTDTSEINLNLNEQIPITGESWKINEEFKEAFKNLLGFAKSLTNFVINVIVFIPVILVAGILVFLLRKYIKNRNK